MTDRTPVRVIEITVRRFYTSDEADFVPATTVVVVEGEGNDPADWDKLMRLIVERCEQQAASAPFDGTRPMTMTEVTRYREIEEAENASVGEPIQ